MGTGGPLSWRNGQTPNFPARMGAGIVLDEARAEILVFGGIGVPPSGLLCDLWSGQGGDWHQQSSASGPSPRISASVAYDRTNQSVLLFGGINGTGQVLGDSWIWNGRGWSEVTPDVSPSARAEASMCTSGDVILLFGGRQIAGRKSIWLADTWVWRGGSWTEVVQDSGPSARSGAAIAYDESRREVVLFGGNDTAPRSDTWIWNGSVWRTPSVDTHPAARTQAAFGFHAGRGVAYLYGGHGNGIAAPFYVSDVWQWNGQGWEDVSPGGTPTAAPDVAASYHPGINALLVLRSTTQKFIQATTGIADAPMMSTDTWFLG